MTAIAARPHRFPIAAALTPADTALLVIDMQVDFCAEHGLLARAGCSLVSMRAPIDPIRRVLAVARKAGLTIVHTREGYAPDLSDAPATKVARYLADGGPGLGDRGPMGRHLIRGEPCWNFIPELLPNRGEVLIDKAGYGAFFRTDLEDILDRKGIRNLVLTGVTTDCCVTSTLREAEDRGYDCLLLTDCCACPTTEIHTSTIELLQAQGLFGTVCESEDFVKATSDAWGTDSVLDTPAVGQTDLLTR